MSLRFLPVLLLAMTCSCQQAEKSGVFQVTATLADNTCGNGALTAEESWDWRVTLSVTGDTLTWTDENGAELTGTLDQQSFSVSATETYGLTAADETTQGCTVRRHERYAGTVDTSGSELRDLEGDAVFTYTEATGADCGDLVGADDGFDTLPCKVSYSFVGAATN